MVAQRKPTGLTTEATALFSKNPRAASIQLRLGVGPPPSREVAGLYASSPRAVASTSIVHLGRYALRAPLVVVLERFADEVIASWPEVECFGSGAIEAEAINALKDQIASLYEDLRDEPDGGLGDLPRRWKAALLAVVDGSRR